MGGVEAIPWLLERAPASSIRGAESVNEVAHPVFVALNRKPQLD